MAKFCSSPINDLVSGHGLQSPTKSPTEPDGFDESRHSLLIQMNADPFPAIVPVDCPYPPVEIKPCPVNCDCANTGASCWKRTYRGAIRDNDLKRILACDLPARCQLVVRRVLLRIDQAKKTFRHCSTAAPLEQYWI